MNSFNQNVIKPKTGLLNLAGELGNTSRACRIMGFSRDTFYRYQAARDAGGVEALFEVSRKKPNLKNRVDEMTEQTVCEFALAVPAHGQLRASNELRKKGVFVSPSGFRSIWLRNGLASMKQRLPLSNGSPPKRDSSSRKRKSRLWNEKVGQLNYSYNGSPQNG